MKDICVVSPDAGGTPKAEYFSNKLGAELVTTHKKRDYRKENAIDKVRFAGNIRGKDILIVDDMMDTGETLEKVVEILKAHGCRRVFPAFGLPIWSKDALPRLDRMHSKKTN